jgi:hypothetical protein
LEADITEALFEIYRIYSIGVDTKILFQQTRDLDGVLQLSDLRNSENTKTSDLPRLCLLSTNLIDAAELNAVEYEMSQIQVSLPLLTAFSMKVICHFQGEKEAKGFLQERGFIANDFPRT